MRDDYTDDDYYESHLRKLDLRWSPLQSEVQSASGSADLSSFRLLEQVLLFVCNDYTDDDHHTSYLPRLHLPGCMGPEAEPGAHQLSSWRLHEPTRMLLCPNNYTCSNDYAVLNNYTTTCRMLACWTRCLRMSSKHGPEAKRSQHPMLYAILFILAHMPRWRGT